MKDSSMKDSKPKGLLRDGQKQGTGGRSGQVTVEEAARADDEEKGRDERRRDGRRDGRRR